MLIAFEGPDKTGKTTSAKYLSYNKSPIHNVTKGDYSEVRESLKGEEEVVQTFDRIGWLTHMVYRLALPDHEWNDARIRTVFSMPDTHLVFKIHDRLAVRQVKDDLYEDGQLVPVNNGYRSAYMYLMELNARSSFSLFKTISVMAVEYHQATGGISQSMIDFQSPARRFPMSSPSLVKDNYELLEFLRYEDSKI